MYNRYINSNGFHDFFRPAEEEPATALPPLEDVVHHTEPPPPPEHKSLLGSLFGGSIKLPDFNADTLLLLVLVYFLVSEENESISDTLLIVGVLLLLGF